jgi:hypothetical protein
MRQINIHQAKTARYTSPALSRWEPERLPARARSRLNDSTNELVFSAASLWEIASKSTFGQADFSVDPRTRRRADRGHHASDHRSNRGQYPVPVEKI